MVFNPLPPNPKTQDFVTILPAPFLKHHYRQLVYVTGDSKVYLTKVDGKCDDHKHLFFVYISSVFCLHLFGFCSNFCQLFVYLLTTYFRCRSHWHFRMDRRWVYLLYVYVTLPARNPPLVPDENSFHPKKFGMCFV